MPLHASQLSLLFNLLCWLRLRVMEGFNTTMEEVKRQLKGCEMTDYFVRRKTSQDLVPGVGSGSWFLPSDHDSAYFALSGEDMTITEYGMKKAEKICPSILKQIPHITGKEDPGREAQEYCGMQADRLPGWRVRLRPVIAEAWRRPRAYHYRHVPDVHGLSRKQPDRRGDPDGAEGQEGPGAEGWNLGDQGVACHLLSKMLIKCLSCKKNKKKKQNPISEKYC